MLNFKPQRTQADGLSQTVSIATATQDDSAFDRTRQEYTKDADVNNLLTRFGVMHTGETPLYKEIDYNIDLQTALRAIQTTREAYRTLPADIRAKYPDWQTLLNAVENGTYESPADEAARKADALKAENDAYRIQVEAILADRAASHNTSTAGTPPA